MSHTMFPRVRRLRRGYHCGQVETFLARVDPPASAAPAPLKPADVRRVGFELVRHGYAPAPVDARLDEIEEALLAQQEGDGGRDPSSDLLVLREQLVAPALQRFAHIGRLRRGYHLLDVDVFLNRVAEMLSGAGEVTVEDVRRVAFRSQRGGYDEGAVDELLDRVVEALLLQRHRAISDDKGRDEHISHPQA
jgi:DivIVA domain-containing protein